MRSDFGLHPNAIPAHARTPNGGNTNENVGHFLNWPLPEFPTTGTFRTRRMNFSPCPYRCPATMAENRNFSPSQQKIIKRFYDNRDQLDEQHLAENVTNLYLATGEKQKAKIWKTVEEMMGRLGVPESRIKHILEKKDPAILAEVVKDLQSGKIKKPAPPSKPQ